MFDPLCLKPSEPEPSFDFVFARRWLQVQSATALSLCGSANDPKPGDESVSLIKHRPFMQVWLLQQLTR